MVAGILISFHLVFNVYLSSQIPKPYITPSPGMSLATVKPMAVQEEIPPAAPVPEYMDEVPAPQLPAVKAEVPVSKEEEMTVAITKYQRPEPSLNASPKKKGLFDVPHGIKKEVEFWTSVYTEYTTDQAVLHDPNNLGRVLGVIDLPHCSEPPKKECLARREDVMKDAKDEMKSKLGRKAPERIRAQVGQKDKFEEGLKASKKYLPKIESVFENMGIPNEISRLPFVESMFNLKAYSKSKAAGIWQLMPSTARIFGLKVGRRNDERYDPVKSTHVAANHLLRDYRRLGSWPLAISAYNSGPGRLADAVRKLGTKDIVRIIKHYDNPSYGFAAKNFYPCFLAALDIYENRYKYFPDLYPGAAPLKLAPQEAPNEKKK